MAAKQPSSAGARSAETTPMEWFSVDPACMCDRALCPNALVRARVQVARAAQLSHSSGGRCNSGEREVSQPPPCRPPHAVRTRMRSRDAYACVLCRRCAREIDRGGGGAGGLLRVVRCDRRLHAAACCMMRARRDHVRYIFNILTSDRPSNPFLVFLESAVINLELL